MVPSIPTYNNTSLNFECDSLFMFIPRPVNTGHYSALTHLST